MSTVASVVNLVRSQVYHTERPALFAIGQTDPRTQRDTDILIAILRVPPRGKALSSSDVHNLRRCTRNIKSSVTDDPRWSLILV